MKSQTPTWAIIVAILMMLIGGCGIKNDIQSINIRSILDMKDKILENMETKAKNSNKTNKEVEVNDEDNDASEPDSLEPVSYTHLRAHETVLDLVCRLLLEKKNKKTMYTTSSLN